MAAGGVSAGGDIAVALAGIDQRISRVAAIAATPDWTRLSMRDIGDPSRVLPQGEPDGYAQWFYNHLDPLTHLSHYSHAPAIAFECGAGDTLVPPDGALRFRDALAKAYPQAAAGVRVTVHPGTGHLEAGQNPALFQNCLAWLAEDTPTPDEAADLTHQRGPVRDRNHPFSGDAARPTARRAVARRGPATLYRRRPQFSVCTRHSERRYRASALVGCPLDICDSGEPMFTRANLRRSVARELVAVVRRQRREGAWLTAGTLGYILALDPVR